ncbi:MAG: two-component system regulatory protein YycI [Clostridiales bacterium]|jgi:regulatory protein YycI of two-component signal transduction system YycFG|nr:two-component system regulatory protein YycI [Clostridiales bacterium]
MDWDRAKTLTIVFLLFLDAFLGYYVYRERNKYYLDARQALIITELLGKNSISLKTAIPRSYQPMRQLSMSGYEYDEYELLEIFFGDPLSADRINELDGKTIYESGDRRLTIQNGFITFDRPAGASELALSSETAISQSREFLRGMGEISAFALDSVFIDEEGCRVRFCQKYRDNIIYTNFIEFLVTEKGVIQIDCIYSRPKGYLGQLTELCAVDEALLNFSQYYKDAYKDRPADVIKIDLVYYQKEGSIHDSASLTAVPYYRVEVEGFERPFLINAYLNRIEQF